MTKFLNGKTGTLRGKITLSKDGLPNEILEELYSGEYSSWFGEGCLNEDNKLYVKLPKNVYLKLSTDTIIEGLGPYLADGETVNPNASEEGHTYLTYACIGFNTPPTLSVGTSMAYTSAINVSDPISDKYEIYANEGKFTEDTTLTIYA